MAIIMEQERQRKDKSDSEDEKSFSSHSSLSSDIISGKYKEKKIT